MERGEGESVRTIKILNALKKEKACQSRHRATEYLDEALYDHSSYIIHAFDTFYILFELFKNFISAYSIQL